MREISAKANKRLHFLKLLKRSAMTTDELLHYYKTVIRPVIEYACPVWQSSLTVDELRRLEAIQKRAIMIIYGAINYEFYCSLYKLEQIQTRLRILTRKFYAKILQPNDCLYRPLPRRELEHVKKLRTFKNFDIVCRTSRFQNSFLPYALRNY